MNIFRTILLVIACMGITETAMSQYSLKLKTDSIGLAKDSVRFFVEEHRGDIKWQVSYDSIHWYDLNQTEKDILIRIFSDGMYRAAIYENTCDPVYSDTAWVFKKRQGILSLEVELDQENVQLIELNDSTETVIEFMVNDDIRFVLTLPASFCCDKNFNYMVIQAVRNILNFPGGLDFLGGMHVYTDIAAFSTPAKLTIQVPTHYDVRRLFVFSYFTEDNLFYPLQIDKITGPEDGYHTVHASIYHFSGIGVGEGTFSECNQYALFYTADDYIAYMSCVMTMAGETSEAVLNHLKPIYFHWYESLVKPAIQNSVFLADIEMAFLEFIKWHHESYARLFEEESDIRYVEFYGLLAKKILKLLEQLDEGCVMENDKCLKKQFLDEFYEIYEFVLNTDLKFPENYQEFTFCGGVIHSVVNSITSNDAALRITLNHEEEVHLECRTLQNDIVPNPELQWDIADHTIIEMVRPGVFRGISTGSTHVTISWCDVTHRVGMTVCDVPTVTTSNASGVDCETATAGGSVVSDNHCEVTERGIVFEDYDYPSGSGKGSYNVYLQSLHPNTSYSYKAYARNHVGIGYGDPVSFKTKPKDECDDECVKVTTASTSNIQCDRLDLGGHVSSCDEVTIVEYGMFSGISPKPEVTGTRYKMGEGIGPYSKTFIFYLFNTTFYVKAYAMGNDGKMYYGEELEFIMERETVTDIEGNVYTTVTIGNQEWMGENLRTRTLNDGTPIPYVNNGYTWFDYMASRTPCCCIFNNHAPNEKIFGLLYNGYAVQTGKICPVGWHVPSKDEWKALFDYLIANGYNYDGTTSGNKIAKALAATRRWYTSSKPGVPGNNVQTNNSSCFSGLPGGHYHSYNYSLFYDKNYFYFSLLHGETLSIGYIGVWWSSTTGGFGINCTGCDSDAARVFIINYNEFSSNIITGTAVMQPSPLGYGLSVRCVKD